MKSINQLIDTKNEYQTKFNEILKKYFSRYMEKLHSQSNNYKDFQKRLLKITEWSPEKSTKEYKKFIDYINDKYELSEDDIVKILDIIFNLSIKIMSSTNYNEIEWQPPKFEIFWLKCLKRIGKYYYENPIVKGEINESIDYIVQKYIPLKDIINSTHKELQYYNFDNISDTIDKEQSSNRASTLDSKNSYSNSLNYIKSEDFENEYYNSDKSINADDDDEKYINLKGKKHLAAPRRKEKLDEKFFDQFN